MSSKCEINGFHHIFSHFSSHFFSMFGGVLRTAAKNRKKCLMAKIIGVLIWLKKRFNMVLKTFYCVWMAEKTKKI